MQTYSLEGVKPARSLSGNPSHPFMADAPSPSKRSERFDIRALYETSRLLNSSLELDFVLNNLLLTTLSKLLVTKGVLFLFREAENEYRLEIQKGATGFESRICLPAASLELDGMVQQDAVPRVLFEKDIKLAVPITFDDMSIGLLGLGEKATGQAFSATELEFIQSLVHMSAAAINNSMMVHQLKKTNRHLDGKIQQLNTLFDLSQEFNATRDRNHLVKTLSRAIMGQLLVKKYLLLYRRDLNREDLFESYRVIGSQGIESLDLDSELLHCMNDIEGHTLVHECEPGHLLDRVKSMGIELILPIQDQGETTAILCLGPKLTGLPYLTEDFELLSALGNLTFVSIKNSFLVDEQIEKERLEEEMRLAREIQEGLLPQDMPEVKGVDIATLALPSRHVGGDYFDVIQLANGNVLFAIADVTGKGVPASLLMANLQACLHTMVPMDLSLEEVCAHMNRVICQNTGYDKFITAFIALYDPRTHTFDYVNAGHNPPMVLRHSGNIELLDKGGLLLGVMTGLPYERGSIELAAEDLVVMFTDGVTEAMSPEMEEYEEDRLEASLRRHAHLPSQTILNNIVSDIEVFTEHTAVRYDDMTLIVAKIKE